ncbi:MAG TPA: RelA/SpoT family protein [Gammaproteobacteria bacterium]|nr:RelA/SpoT family protein [Gammaproteobacteria bacterium]
MVKPKQKNQFYSANGNLDIAAFIQNIQEEYLLDNVVLLIKACTLTQKLTKGLTTFYGIPCVELGLEIAKIILDLKLDQETAAAGVISCATSVMTPSIQEIILTEMGSNISQLIAGLQQINSISPLQNLQTRNQLQIENLRNMLLTLATDIRVVIIKLAERLCFMRGIKGIAREERRRFAQETLDIYAPLANRLGIGQVKWELEDLAFRYLDFITYQSIASLLTERRIDRENRIKKLIAVLQEKLSRAQIQAKMTGRAKHIYSIYLKMQHKNKNYINIYDHIAVRILVASIEDCYTALSVVHQLWAPLMSEFNDYIAHPKTNGYRSIHTTVIDEKNNHFEIQIRTHFMHEEAERGIAAHWLYKETQSTSADINTKITYIRQLLDWHKEVIKSDQPTAVPNISAIDPTIYVITPAGDILGLPKGATPLDFAYHIHSELGHRCRGAKINGQMVSLNHPLKTGDNLEMITIPQGNPSRDWLNLELGYITTTRAKNKISHWFKQQAFDDDVRAGKSLLERELLKQGINKTPSLHTIAKQFNLNNEDALLAALNRGNIRLSHVIQLIQPKQEDKVISLIIPVSKKLDKKSVGSAIVGNASILTRVAKCCKPVPDDSIIGYITQGRGISIHQKNCHNVNHFSNRDRIIEIQWEPKTVNFFSTDLKIIVHDQTKILNDLSSLFANEKIDLLNFNSLFNKNKNVIVIIITIQVQNKEQLQQQLQRIQQLPGVIEVKRI